MKYGETLPLFSAPQFANNNLEYNAVKDIIKKRTSACTLVTDSSQQTEFEDEIFGLLVEQLESINLFVRFKAGEIQRRLDAIARLLASPPKKETRTGYRLYSRYGRLERDVEAIGNDIQALSRFRESNRIGFVKLLKKYKKWTGSGTLSKQLSPLLSEQSSFTNYDLDGLLNQMMSVLEDVRNARATSPIRGQSTAASSTDSLPLLHKQSASAQEFDAQLDAGDYNRATYWVNGSSLIELQVFISRSLTARLSSASNSGAQTPLPSSTPTLVRSLKEDEVGEIVFDDETEALERIVRHGGETESIAQHPTALIRWIDNTEAPDISLVIPASKSVQRISGSRKLVNALLTGKASKKLEGSDFAKLQAANPKISPLVTIKANRARFLGPSIAAPIVWATVDRDVRMSKVVKGANWNSGAVEEFPYAVLSVYWEKAADKPQLLHVLDSSHLAVSVPQFTIEAHAMATLLKHEDAKAPSWFDKLSEELFKHPPAPILKLPSKPRMGSRRNKSPLRESSASTASVSQGEFSPSNAYSTEPTSEEEGAQSCYQKKSSKRRPVGALRSDSAWLGQNKYWSELNEEEADRDQPFTIVLHDNDDSSSLVDSFKTSFFKFIGRKRYFADSDGEEQPLLGNSEPSASDNEQVFSYDPLTHNLESTYPLSARKGYLYGYITCYLLSISFLILSVILVFREPKKKHSPEAWFRYTLRVALAVTTSLCLDVCAISLFIARRRTVGWVHSSLAYGGFTFICLFAGAVLAMVENN